MKLYTPDELWDRTRAFLREGLWRAEHTPGLGSPISRLRRLLQFAVMVGEGFVRDHLLLRATALSYFTVLSVIPLLAVVISIAQSVGIGADFADLIVGQLAAGNPEAQAFILERTRGFNFAGLGTLGAAVLLVTTVLGINVVEKDLNAIWGVHQERTLARRFADYLAVLVVGPVLLATSLSLATTLQSQWLVQRLFEYRFFSLLYDLGLQQAPTVVLAAAFSFLYWFLPNTRVRPLSAILGGVVAGVLVVLAQSLYLGLMVGSVRYGALFGSFAALPLLLVWIYLFWAVVLFGAEVAFACDNLSVYRREVRGRAASPAESEAVGLRVALEVARAFRDGAPAWTSDGLAETLDVPVRTVRTVLSELDRAGIVAARGAVEEEGGYQLGRPAETIPVTDVVAALRGVREKTRGDPEVSVAVEGVLGELDAGAEKGAAGRSLADLLTALPPAQAEARLMRIYLDHNATTPVRDEVADAMQAALRGCFGNPSSVHAEGAAARAAVERARERVAGLLACEPREVLFTAGATEANNTLLSPLLRAWAGGKRHVVSSNAEHPSVEEPLAALEREGWLVTRLPVSSDGLLDPDRLAAALRPDTALVTLLWANNETGVVQPMDRLASLARARGVRIHADATQCVGKLRVDLREIPLDALSLSAHKLGGPKGVGALVVRGETGFEALLRGGPQERRRRGGTENVPGILGLGAAAALAARELAERRREYARLRDRLWDGIAAKIPRVRRNGAESALLCNTLSVEFEGVAGELLLQALDLDGIAVSTGAACASGRVEASHVLLAMGRSLEQSRATLRFSVGHGVDDAQIERVLSILPDRVVKVRDAGDA